MKEKRLRFEKCSAVLLGAAFCVEGGIYLKIYLYCSKAVDCVTLIGAEMVRIARSCFTTNEEIKVVPIDGLPTGSGERDYFCVVDGKIGTEPKAKRLDFSKSLDDILSKAFGRKICGKVMLETGHTPIKTVSTRNISDDEEFDFEKRAEQFKPTDPVYTFDRVILPEPVLVRINEALNIIEYEDKVFREWGLSAIQPYPASAMSFFGPSGTGKTMAAEAIANKLGKKILKVSYADIESKFQGEGPKMVKAIFMSAQREEAVLFIDEADSLLSKRLTNVTQGSEQAINSMRSQLLICLEHFHGVVIFATNLVVNYDQAFLTRLISVEFEKPDVSCRKRIWDVHIKPVNGNKLNIPLSEDVDTQELAEQYEFCGREIRKAVISACVSVAMDNRDLVSQADFKIAADKVIAEEKSLAQAGDYTRSVRDSKENAVIIKQDESVSSIIKEKIHTQQTSSDSLSK